MPAHRLKEGLWVMRLSAGARDRPLLNLPCHGRVRNALLRLISVSSAHKRGEDGPGCGLPVQRPPSPTPPQLTGRACSHGSGCCGRATDGRAASQHASQLGTSAFLPQRGAALSEGIWVLPPHGETCPFKKDHL